MVIVEPTERMSYTLLDVGRFLNRITRDTEGADTPLVGS